MIMLIFGVIPGTRERVRTARQQHGTASHSCGPLASFSSVKGGTELGCVRNRTLEGQRGGNTSESASRSQDDL